MFFVYAGASDVVSVVGVVVGVLVMTVEMEVVTRLAHQEEAVA